MTILLLLSFPLCASHSLCASYPPCASLPLYASSILLYTFLVCFLLKEGGERERESKNKQTYLLCFLKKEEGEGERVEEEGEVRKTLAPPFYKGL